jgi:pimeloyl-ACP methyl ester carboxylesterase
VSAPPTTELQLGGRRVEILDLPGDLDLRPLILLHEGLGSIDLWRGFHSELQRATERRVIAYSRYGHGCSASPPVPRTPAFFHDEALRILPMLCEQLGVLEPVLVGHSDGGSIAVIHAAHHAVSALVLLAPHVFVEAKTVEAIRRTRDTYLQGRLRERMARYHADPDAAFWGWCNVWLDPAFLAWNLEAELARVRAPALLIQGAEDPYGTLEQLDRIEAHLPGSRRLVLPGGHSPHLEHGRDVVEAVTEFLRRAC